MKVFISNKTPSPFSRWLHCAWHIGVNEEGLVERHFDFKALHVL